MDNIHTSKVGGLKGDCVLHCKVFAWYWGIVHIITKEITKTKEPQSKDLSNLDKFYNSSV